MGSSGLNGGQMVEGGGREGLELINCSLIVN